MGRDVRKVRLGRRQIALNQACTTHREVRGRRLDPLVGHDVGHECLDYDEAKLVHGLAERLADRLGDMVFLLEDVVEADRGHRGAYCVLDVSPDLLMRVAQAVESLDDVALLRLILH